MSNVCIVGAGIHPFGRHPDKSGLQQGVDAARAALADAGVEWHDIQFAFGGSEAAGNADAVLPQLGLTGVQFINVKNGCATGGSALLSAYWAIKSGEFDLGIAIGFDKHPHGAFNADPRDWGLPPWYGETGLMLTTQFFGMKIQRYMALHGITPRTLAKVAEKAFDNGSRGRAPAGEHRRWLPGLRRADRRFRSAPDLRERDAAARRSRRASDHQAAEYWLQPGVRRARAFGGVHPRERVVKRLQGRCAIMNLVCGCALAAAAPPRVSRPALVEAEWT